MTENIAVTREGVRHGTNITVGFEGGIFFVFSTLAPVMFSVCPLSVSLSRKGTANIAFRVGLYQHGRIGIPFLRR